MKRCKFLAVFVWGLVFCCLAPPPVHAQNELIPPGTTTLADDAFSNRDDLTTVVIPDGVVSIGRSAFSNCKNLVSVVMPNSVTTIGKSAFANCVNLKTVALSDNLTVIEEGMFAGCTELETITLPAKVARIGDFAFSSCEKLASCDFPTGLEEIGKYAFRYCRFTELDLPAGLKKIGEDGFMSCKNLERVSLPDGFSTLGRGVFFLCTSLKAFEVSEKNASFSTLDGVLFSKDKKKLYLYPPMKGEASYTLPDATTSYAWSAFSNCTGLVSLNLNKVTATDSDENMMWQCTDLKEISVAEDNTAFASVDGVLYSKQKDRLVVYPMGRPAASFSIPAGVTSIRQFAFYYNTHLTSVTMPASVASIGRFIFGGCTEIKELHLGSAVPPALSNGLGNETRLTVYVPEGSANAYRAAAVWRTENIGFVEEDTDVLGPEIGEVSDHTVIVSWQPVAEATAYYVKVYADAAHTILVAEYDLNAAGQLRSAGLVCEIKDLKAGSSYYVEIGAVKQEGEKTVVLACSQVEVQTTGVPTSNAEIEANGVVVFTRSGELVVESAVPVGVQVYSISGSSVATREVYGTETIRLPGGVYIVVVGETKYKVAL